MAHPTARSNTTDTRCIRGGAPHKRTTTRLDSTHAPLPESALVFIRPWQHILNSKSTIASLPKWNEAMTERKAASEGVMRLMRRRPWSTFPRGRFMKTLPCTNDQKDETATHQPQHCALMTLQPCPSAPEHVVTSLTIMVGITSTSHEERDKHVRKLASFFASSVSYESKLARIRTLVTLVTPQEASSWQLRHSVLKDTLRFVTDRQFDWPHAEHSAHVVLLELRAMCLYEMERRSVVVKSGTAAADCILGGARMVEFALVSSIPLIHVSLDFTGKHMKRLLTPSPPLSPRNQIVAKTYMDAAKRASNGVRETARWTCHTIRDVSTYSIHKIAETFDQQQLGERFVPNEGYRNVLVATGTVGMASVGAAAIVGEAMFEISKAVALKSSQVTADVVRYKYGESAGRVVEDASHTTGNLLRTVAHAAMLETSVLAKAVAKNTAKVQAQRFQEMDDDAAHVGNTCPSPLEIVRSKSYPMLLKSVEETKVRQSKQQSPGEASFEVVTRTRIS